MIFSENKSFTLCFSLGKKIKNGPTSVRVKLTRPLHVEATAYSTNVPVYMYVTV